MAVPREQERTSDVPAPFGVLAEKMNDNMYTLDGGAIFTSPWVVTDSTVRRAGSLLLTAEGDPFDLRVRGSTNRYQAVVVKPLVARALRAENAQLISVFVNPLHPRFRMFRGMPTGGVLALPREAFAAYDAGMRAAYRGELKREAAIELFEGLIATAADYLPSVRMTRSDVRVDQVIELLQLDVNRSLSELAQIVGVSYGRMSHLFSKSMGISLRSYQLWLKIYRALDLLDTGATLTEIAEICGFTDLAHFSRTAQQAFGAPLSYFQTNPSLRAFFYRRRLPKLR